LQPRDFIEGNSGKRILKLMPEFDENKVAMLDKTLAAKLLKKLSSLAFERIIKHEQMFRL